MTTKAEIQALLRFLSQDAKVPLPIAMSKIKDLQRADLISTELIAKADSRVLVAIFTEEKQAKQVLNAAKRVSKKRASGDLETPSPIKRKKPLSSPDAASPVFVEESLALPLSNAGEEELNTRILYTNRAPLVLAFAVMLISYTMPSQPLSSRLSLAQAVVSANSRSKAISLGIEKGNSAENEGWGRGQPTVKIMGRSICVMKRWGYDPTEGTDNSEGGMGPNCDYARSGLGNEDSQSTIKGEGEEAHGDHILEEQPALWGLDLEALRTTNDLLIPDNQDMSKLPIYTPQSARTYMVKSFVSVPSLALADSASPKKRPSAAVVSAEKERNLGLLLRALDLLYSSWSKVLSTEELDRRAWSWYVAVRPEVQNGVAGWGGKGEVKLAQILEMRRKE